MNQPERAAGVVAVVLCYNGISTLPEVLQAIRGQTVPVSKTIVVDNGSTDGTPDFLIREGGPDLEPVLLSENSGVGCGHNEGWRRALQSSDCEFIWSLEHDCIPHPDCLETLLQVYRGTTGSGSDRMGGLFPLQLAPYLLDPQPCYVWRGRFQRMPKLHDYSRPFVSSLFTFNGTLFRAAAVRAVGFLREDLFLTYEDFEYRSRMEAAEFYFVRVPAALVRHDLLKAHPVRRAFGRTWYFPGGNSVARSYYAVRNSTFLRLQGSNSRVLFILAALGKLAGSLAYILLVGPERRRRLRARFHGVIDGLRERLGGRDTAFFR